MGFFSWFTPSHLSRLKKEIEQKQIQDKAKKRIWGRLRVSVPKRDWQPEKAAALMASLFRLQDYTVISFQIYVWHDKEHTPNIGWYIKSYSDMSEVITRLVYSIYPYASVEYYPDAKFWQFSETVFFSVAPFFAPFVYVQDCKVDPLIQVLGVLDRVKQGTICLELQMFDVAHDYNAMGEKAIHQKQGNDAVKIIMSAVATGGRMILPPIPKPINVYEAPYQRQFEDKVNSELRVFGYVLIMEDVDARTQKEIVAALSHSLTVFEREPGNRFTTKGYNLIFTAQEAAALWHPPSKEVNAAGIDWLPPTYSSIPEELIGKEEGLYLGSNQYRAASQRVYLPLPDRITHMNIIGKTRVGKTTFMHNLIHQDIAAGRGVGVIDPHGDLIKSILAGSIPQAREKDVVLFDLSNPRRLVPLNLLYVPQGAPPHAAVGSTIAVLKKIFAEAWSQTRMEDALYAALAVLVAMRGATIRDIPRLFFEEDYRQLVLANATDPVALEYFHNDFERMSESHQLEVARPIMNRIRTFYRNPVIEQVVAQPDSLDLKYIMDQGKILLVSLAGEATQAEAATIGALLISKLQMAAMSRYSSQNRRMFYLYIDEVQNFITTSLSTMFSEAAKYGLSLTVANQYMRQLEGGTLDAIMGNTGTTVMFAMGNQDAKDLGPYVKPNFDSQTLLDLDRFEAIVRMQHQGKTLPAFWLKTPSPVKLPDNRKRSKAAIRASEISDRAFEIMEQSPACFDFCKKKELFSGTTRSTWTEYLHDWVDLHPEDKEKYSEFLTMFTREFWKYHHSTANPHDSAIASYIDFIDDEFLQELEPEDYEPVSPIPVVQGASPTQPKPQLPKQPDAEVPDLNL